MLVGPIRALRVRGVGFGYEVSGGGGRAVDGGGGGVDDSAVWVVGCEVGEEGEGGVEVYGVGEGGGGGGGGGHDAVEEVD